MEAVELMVGDYVKCNPHCPGHRVDYISELEEEVGVDGEILSLGMIEPIPLTPEILEKNGFVKSVNVRDAPPYDNNIYYSIIQDGNTIFWGWWQPDNTLLIPTYSTGFITLNNVHELQHALRLCGIEKEINL